MKAKELDLLFDNGEDVLEYFDLDSLKRPGLEMDAMQISFPHWMMEAMEKEAERMGVDIQSVIKMWITQRLDAMG
ncbi:hypothetical protein Cyast_2725 [Cyanobacterium stanieri PCC 7202]|uniref:CopG family transcriptional regulator n=1 Tax=Cyanobacterium stanieri (strain ATCC 29140 / PCC 7202) TaxID=292563 RepID=K9YQC4_CYASC|nr:hypothetical protein Cyast_2725 [Cyanobacterium stanieri PCC 7202]